MSTKTEKEPLVSIIILSWNGWKDTLECLESVYQINYSNYNLIVVDNASQDGSVEKIEEYCRGEIEVKSNFFNYRTDNKPIKIIKNQDNGFGFDSNENSKISALPFDRKLFLIENRKNYGYAEGNNVGIRQALKTFDPEYILLLNNDTVVDADFLKELVKIAQKDRLKGVLNPKILNYDHPHEIQSAGGRIIWSLGVGEHIGDGKIDDGQHYSTEIDYAVGAAILIRKSLLEEIGTLDKRFFLLFEDCDLCVRAKKAGYKIIFVPGSEVYHKNGFSRGNGTDNLYYSYRNRLIFTKKNMNGYTGYIYLLNISLRMFILTGIFFLRRDFKSGKKIIEAYNDSYLN